MMNLPISTASLILFFACSRCYSQPNASVQEKQGFSWQMGSSILSLGGSYRLRAERQANYHIKTYGTGEKEEFVLSRLRMEMDWQYRQNARLHVQWQDARAVGVSISDQEFSAGNNPFHDPLDVNQAYLELQPIRQAKIKIGRQPISFRDRRVFGPGDWGNTGRYTWDAAVLTFNSRWFDSHWLIGRYIFHNPNQWPNRRAPAPTAYAGYHSIKELPVLLDLFYVFKHDTRTAEIGESGTGHLASHSLGCYMSVKYRSWEMDITTAGQTGKKGSAEIQAFGLAGALGYQFQIVWKPLLRLQYILGSGDKNPRDGLYGTFDGVFGGADTDLYGWMNLFFWQNLREYRLDLSLTPHQAIGLKCEYHYFALDQASDAWYYPGKAQRRDQSGASGRELGHETDLIVKFKATDHWQILTGFGYFSPAEYIAKTGKNPITSWMFLESTLYF